METLRGVISDFSAFIYSGLVSLPLNIAGTMLLIGLFTANYAMLFFLVGFLIAVPFVNFLWNLLLKLPAEAYFPQLLRRNSDVCGIIIPFLSENSKNLSDETYISSQWTAMVSFFFGYLIRNAIKLFKKDIEPTTSIEVTPNLVKEYNNKATYRKTQSMVSVISIVITIILIFVMRYRSGCETFVGMLLSIIPFGISGYFWYDGLSAIQQDRLSDLFGIANRLLPPSAIANGPVVCLPTEQ